jgi:hypothetical protein
MRAISGRGVLALCLASHGSNFKVPSDYYTMAPHRVFGLTRERASHVLKCPLCNETPPQCLGSGYSSTVSGTSMSGQRSTSAMLMDHNPRCPCSWCAIQPHDRVVHVLEELMLKAWAIKGRGLRREVRRIRSGASRYRLGDVAWLDFMAPHRHLVVDVTVTSARTNTIVPQIGARLPFPGSNTSEAQQGKLEAGLRTSALLGTPPIKFVHYY